MVKPGTLRHRLGRWSGLSRTDGGGAEQSIPWSAPIICLIWQTSLLTLFGWLLSKTSWGSDDWPILAPMISGQSTILYLAGLPARRRLRHWIGTCVAIGSIWIAEFGIATTLRPTHSSAIEFAASCAAAVIGSYLFTAIYRFGPDTRRPSTDRTQASAGSDGNDLATIEPRQG